MISEKETKENEIVEGFMSMEDSGDMVVADDNEMYNKNESLEIVSWGRGDFAALFRGPGEESMLMINKF